MAGRPPWPDGKKAPAQSRGGKTGGDGIEQEKDWIHPLPGGGQGIETVYPQLEKSALTPPDYIFPVVWTVLYILMGLGLALALHQGGPTKTRAAALWWLQLALNFFWTWLFFVQFQYFSALICLVVLWLAILAMTLSFARLSRAAAVLQLPYLVWVAFAGYLNWVVYRLNL
mgnify:CR=1 FL=1